MLAGYIREKGKIDLVEVEEPTLDGPPVAGARGGGAFGGRTGGESSGEITGEIIVQPFLGCLCGSDIPFFDGPDEWGPPPHKIGQSLHELLGTVVASNGKKFRVGERVLAVPIEHQGLFQRFRLSEERAIPLDDRRPPEHALMAQPLGTVLFALKKLPSLLDLDVAVVGQGPIGQMFIAAARCLGARRIVAVERLRERAEVCSKMGATHVVCTGGATSDGASDEQAVEAVSRVTGGRMADVVIEAVGHHEQAFNLCIDLCGENGRILYFGVPPEAIDGLRFRDLFFKSISVHTSVNPDFYRDFPLAMQWISEGRIDLSPLISHRFPLAEIQTAFELFRDRREGALKVLIDFPS